MLNLIETITLSNEVKEDITKSIIYRILISQRNFLKMLEQTLAKAIIILC